MNRIMIVDDDRDILAALEIYLTTSGYQVIRAENGREAVRRMEEEPADLILMDVMMPQMDGIAATRIIREKSNVPILFLTAKSEDVDLIHGLNVGADDYITKPFKPMEVLARIRSHLRRFTQLGGQPRRDNVLTVGPVQLEDESKRVTVDGEPVNLTPLEYNILRLLRQKKQASRKEIEAFLGCSSFPATTALNSLIEQGRVVKTGVARGTKYMLAE